MAAMTKTELTEVVSQLVRDCEDYRDQLSAVRVRAMEYYDGVMADVPAEANRSKVVSRDVRVAVKKVLPSLTCEPDEAETKDFRLPEAAETFGWAQLGPPPVGRGNRLINALLQCRADFFEALGEEKNAFGKVALKQAAGP